MQGIFLTGYKRPKSKKEIKDTIAKGGKIIIEATSVFGNEYGGLLEDAPDGDYTFVGPDPFTSRKFYGTITKRNGTIKVK